MYDLGLEYVRIYSCVGSSVALFSRLFVTTMVGETSCAPFDQRERAGLPHFHVNLKLMCAVL